MDFIEYTQNWTKSEVLQGRIMIGIGIILLVVAFFIYRSENALLKGAIIPLSLLIVVLIGYGGFILSSRPAYAKESIALFEKSPEEALAKSKSKHTNDNKWGKNLIKYAYPLLMLVSAISLFFLSSPYYRGMALGFLVLFVATYIIDSGL